MLPEDIHPVSRCRLPPPRREDFDDAGKAVFDTYVDPKGGSIRGLQGPGGIQLHSPKLAEINRPGNKYLRFECGLTPREREVAILITARECDSRFELGRPRARSCARAACRRRRSRPSSTSVRSTACRKRTPSSCSSAARPSVQRQGVPADLQARVRALRRPQAGRPRRADGQVRGHGRHAVRVRHAARRRRNGAAAARLTRPA